MSNQMERTPGNGGVKKAEKKGRPAADDHLAAMMEKAIQKLTLLYGEAIAARFYGKMRIEIDFENGRPYCIRYSKEGVEK